MRVPPSPTSPAKYPLSAEPTVYKPVKPSRSEFIWIRNSKQHIRRWGDDRSPVMILLHGWFDNSASFQFFVDAMTTSWNIIAPDLSGFGYSANRTGIYGYADYLADLESLVDHYAPEQKVVIVGHSMGANVASLYAGIRAHRVAGFVTIEGFGPVPPFTGMVELKRLAKWLNAARGGPRRRCYSDYEELTGKLMTNNRRLTPERAAFLARALSTRNPDGTIQLAADPMHQKFVGQPRVSPDLYYACWQQIDSPVYWVAGRESHIIKAFNQSDESRTRYQTALASFSHVRETIIDNCSHNVHVEQPEELASLIDGLETDIQHD